MTTPEKSFLGFAAIVLPSVLVFVLYSGLYLGLLPLLGLFLVLVFCNRLPRK